MLRAVHKVWLPFDVKKLCQVHFDGHDGGGSQYSEFLRGVPLEKILILWAENGRGTLPLYYFLSINYTCV